MAIVINNQQVNLAARLHIFGPSIIPNSATSIVFYLAYQTLATPTLWPDPAVQMTAKAYISTDGGATYTSMGGTGSYGGPHVDEDGIEVPYADMHLSPLPPGTNRLLRVEVLVVGGNLRSRLTVEVLP